MFIRRADKSEAQTILNLIIELAVYEDAGNHVTATIEHIDRSFFCEHPTVFCDFVEDDSGSIVGFAVWFLNYSTWTGTSGIYLEDLFIKPNARGKGYGKALVKHLAKVCIDRGYHRLQWWVLNWNHSSIEFYKALGAQLMNDWTVMRVSDESLIKLSQED